MESFEEKMTELSTKLKEQIAKAEKLDSQILENLKALGYGKWSQSLRRAIQVKHGFAFKGQFFCEEETRKL